MISSISNTDVEVYVKLQTSHLISRYTIESRQCYMKFFWVTQAVQLMNQASSKKSAAQ